MACLFISELNNYMYNSIKSEMYVDVHRYSDPVFFNNFMRKKEKS